MTPSQALLSLLTSHPPPLLLPPSLLSSPSLFSSELLHVHSCHPFFAGVSSLHLPVPGAHFTVELGDSASLVLTRALDGRAHALHNHCTHQNARLCPSSRPDLLAVARGGELRRAMGAAAAEAEATEAKAERAGAASAMTLLPGPQCAHAERLICPFHHWTFALDGAHLAPRTALTADPAQRKHFALARARALWEEDGLLLVDARRAQPDAAEERAMDEEARDEWTLLRRTVRGARITEAASALVGRNWKAAWAALKAQRVRSAALFPSALCLEEDEDKEEVGEGARLLVQLLPLTPSTTALTAFRVGSAGVRAEGGFDAEWWRRMVAVAAASGAEEDALEGRDRERYHRWMVEGLSDVVDKEEKARKEHERRRDKLLRSA